MRGPVAFAALVLAFAGAASAYLVSNAPRGGAFVFESIPGDRRPAALLVDTESVPGVADPLAVTQSLVQQWNGIAGAEAVFGSVTAGGPFNGSNVAQTFGVFTNRTHEVAWDDTGAILAHFGLSQGVLGITLKSVDAGSGRLLDFLIVVNTQPGFLSAPGATEEELFRATLLHELGHALGLGHSPVGMTNTGSFGLLPADPDQMPTMFPFRFSDQPQEGGTIEADDRAPVALQYPAGASGTGGLAGRVRGLSGAAANEVVVRAVGPDGAATASHVGVFSNSDGGDAGRFRIDGLAPGRYRLLVEPLNGRASVTSDTLADANDLGGNPFVFVDDELWNLGDTFDPANDDPADSDLVTVRAGRVTGGLDFTLNGAPLVNGDAVGGTLEASDARLGIPPNFHFVDYFVLDGDVGESIVVDVTAAGFSPQLRLLGPADLATVAADLPDDFGAQATINHTLGASGIHTVVLWARAPAGSPLGGGNYTISLSGGGDPLPAPPAPAPAVALAGPMDPGAQQFGNPLCDVALLQVRLRAPALEELWVDALRVRLGGSADDAADVTAVKVVHDLDGDGVADGNEPVLATVAPGSDDALVDLAALDLQIAPGATADLLVAVDVSVVAPPAPAGFPLWVFLPAALLLLALRRSRGLALAALLVFAPPGCGGGGSDPVCNFAFDPDAPSVTLTATLAQGDVTATTPTMAPGATIPDLPPAPLASGTLEISH